MRITTFEPRVAWCRYQITCWLNGILHKELYVLVYFAAIVTCLSYILRLECVFSIFCMSCFLNQCHLKEPRITLVSNPTVSLIWSLIVGSLLIMEDSMSRRIIGCCLGCKRKLAYTYSVLICHIDDLVQDCSNSIANALGLLRSCTNALGSYCSLAPGS